MNSFKEMAKRIKELAWGISTIEEAAEMEAIAKQLEEFEAVIFVSIDENGANVTASATAGFPLRVATHDYVEGVSGVISEFVSVGDPNKLEEWIAAQLKGSGDDENLD